MPVFENFPYTNYHDLNLDYILHELKQQENEIKDLYDRIRVPVDGATGKVLIISDSYGDGWSPDGMTTSFAALMLQEISGFKTHEGGAGFAAVGQLGHTFEDLLRNFVTAFPDDVPTIGTILVAGGINDQNSTAAAITTAINSFISYAKTALPQAEIKIAYISFYGYNGLTAFNKMIPAYQSANGAGYIGNSEYILINRNEISSDGIHPLQAGQNRLAKYLLQGLKQGYIDEAYFDSNALLFTPDTGVTFTINDGYKATLIRNGVKTLTIPSFSINFASATNVSPKVKLGTWASPYINSAYPIRIPLTLAIRRSADNLFQSQSGYLTLQPNKDLEVEINYANNSMGWSTLNANLINMYEPTIGMINLVAPIY